MTGSVMARRGRHTIISQLLETLWERLFAVSQAVQFSGYGMRVLSLFKLLKVFAAEKKYKVKVICCSEYLGNLFQTFFSSCFSLFVLCCFRPNCLSILFFNFMFLSCIMFLYACMCFIDSMIFVTICRYRT